MESTKEPIFVGASELSNNFASKLAQKTLIVPAYGIIQEKCDL
jgi:hypothetical protein